MTAEELAERLPLWIREKVEKAGCRGAVFGMSGGIDSSVVAVLSGRALPGNVLGVIMPCHSVPQDEEHALAVAGEFKIPTEKVVLDGVFDTLIDVFPDNAVSPTARRLAQENLKARLRMLSLYHFANQLGYLVVGSGNKSELAVGHFTKHGDSGVDILPIGNLVKAKVRELAAFLGILQEIIHKPPSAGFWEGQTDEADLGFTYEELDKFLTTGKVSDEYRSKIESMIAERDHKRQPPPVPPF